MFFFYRIYATILSVSKTSLLSFGSVRKLFDSARHVDVKALVFRHDDAVFAVILVSSQPTDGALVRFVLAGPGSPTVSGGVEIGRRVLVGTTIATVTAVVAAMVGAAAWLAFDGGLCVAALVAIIPSNASRGAFPPRRGMFWLGDVVIDGSIAVVPFVDDDSDIALVRRRFFRGVLRRRKLIKPPRGRGFLRRFFGSVLGGFRESSVGNLGGLALIFFRQFANHDRESSRRGLWCFWFTLVPR